MTSRCATRYVLTRSMGLSVTSFFFSWTLVDLPPVRSISTRVVVPSAAVPQLASRARSAVVGSVTSDRVLLGGGAGLELRDVLSRREVVEEDEAA